MWSSEREETSIEVIVGASPVWLVSKLLIDLGFHTVQTSRVFAESQYGIELLVDA